MAAWIETCRSVVSPWECDVTEHFTIAYYFDRLADAAVTTAENLGLRDLAGSVRRRFDVRFVRELRAGASFHILSAPIAQNMKAGRSEEHTSELQSHLNLVCRLLLEKKKNY